MKKRRLNYELITALLFNFYILIGVFTLIHSSPKQAALWPLTFYQYLSSGDKMFYITDLRK